MTAWIFPGQGAQKPGMGKRFYDEFPKARSIFEEADDLLKENFSKVVFESDAETLALTRNSQLSIYIVSIAMAEVLKSEIEMPKVVGGLSLGEYTALTMSGRAKFSDVLLLVRRRGELMHEASMQNPGTLAAVLGLELEPLKEVTDSLGMWVANLNCPGQIVIAGSHNQVQNASEKLKDAGAKRVVPLDVSGAFHSGLMEPAKVGLAPFVQKLPLEKSAIRLAMNVPGDFVESEAEIRSNLIEQVSSTVKWQSCIEAMQREGISQFVEIGPGNTLTGMNRKISREIETQRGELLCGC